MSQKPEAGTITPASLVALAGLGALAALWSLFLWGELRLARAGGSPFCGLGDSADCAAVWDSAFASSVHRLTGMPVAGWGLVWGLVAFALPVAALLRAAQGRPLGPLASAMRVTAAGGAVAVFVFVAVSLSERALCFGCFATYVIAGGYAGIALTGWRNVGLPEAGRGFALSAGCTLAAYFLLLYPGTRTPRSNAEASRAALAQIPIATSASANPATPAPATPASAGPASPVSADPASPAAPEADGLAAFVASLPQAQKQTLSDALFAYRQASPRPLGIPRLLVGPASAPVRITEFTDVLCSHCAELHETLHELTRRVPPGSFSVEPRHFPLDGECNPMVTRRDAPVRCLAARAQICLERKPGAFDFAGTLFERQRSLKPDMVLAIAQTHAPRSELQACIASPETATKLRSDIDQAAAHGVDGTPLVLVNGRRGASFGPFLYAMVLTKGSPEHPAFAALPPPNPQAHVH
jgi:serine/threonine-protein kinase